MTYNPDKHHRRSVRLKDYDYATVGAYFVITCTQRRECLFGEIADDEMVLNDAGRMVDECLSAIPGHFDLNMVDSYVVMPNHFHCIITDSALV